MCSYLANRFLAVGRPGFDEVTIFYWRQVNVESVFGERLPADEAAETRWINVGAIDRYYEEVLSIGYIERVDELVVLHKNAVENAYSFEVARRNPEYRSLFRLDIEYFPGRFQVLGDFLFRRE